uniref:hypothetical protein n=1 Tax=Nonomuraea pusilla TaxID=46177 RepID=UPI00128FC751|nr:hypothetical protein [Nonomuraea pusilla]
MPALGAGPALRLGPVLGVVPALVLVLVLGLRLVLVLGVGLDTGLRPRSLGLASARLDANPRLTGNVRSEDDLGLGHNLRLNADLGLGGGGRLGVDVSLGGGSRLGVDVRLGGGGTLGGDVRFRGGGRLGGDVRLRGDFGLVRDAGHGLGLGRTVRGRGLTIVEGAHPRLESDLGVGLRPGPSLRPGVGLRTGPSLRDDLRARLGLAGELLGLRSLGPLPGSLPGTLFGSGALLDSRAGGGALGERRLRRWVIVQGVAPIRGALQRGVL